jgi:hypothetical protein
MTTENTFKEDTETSAEKLTTQCPTCKRLLRVPKRESQLRAKCPSCHAMFVVDPPKPKPGDDTVAGWVLDDVDEAEQERMDLIALPPLPPGERRPKSGKKESTPSPRAATSTAPDAHALHEARVTIPGADPKTGPDESQRKRETGMTKLQGLLARQKSGHVDRQDAARHAPGLLDRATWDADSYPQDVNLPGVPPHLVVKECTPAGVRFRFDSVWLAHPGFRASIPLRCFASGHHIPDELYARPMVFCDQSGGQLRSPQEVTTGVGLRMAHRTPREIEAQLAKVEHVPTPFDNPVPYYATMACGDFYMECTTHKRGDGGWTCEVLIPDHQAAIEWLANVNGVTGPEYRLLQKDAAAAHSESWAGLPLGIRMRLAFWIGFASGETFTRYFNDATALANDAGLAGLCVTSRRLIHRHRFTTAEANVTDPSVTLLIRVEKNTPVLFLKKGSESSCIARLRVDDVNDFVDIISNSTSFNLELADI